MVNQRQMTKKTKAKRKTSNQGVSLPSRFPRPADDVVTANVRFSYALVAAGTSPFVTTKLISFGNAADSGDYLFLGNLSSVFGAYSEIYSRFMITEIRANLKTTGIGSGNALAAVNYTPGNSGVSLPPSSLSEVAQAVHFCDATMGAPGSFRLNASEYYNDWRQTIDTNDASDSQCGVMKVYGVGSSGGASIGILDVELRVHFCGLRVLNG